MAIHIISALIFFLLGVLWSKENFGNLSFKVLLLLLAICHAWEAVTLAGYIVRV